jgi:hypothetical protein
LPLWWNILWWPIDDCHSEDFCRKIELITDVNSDRLGANFGEQRWFEREDFIFRINRDPSWLRRPSKGDRMS